MFLTPCQNQLGKFIMLWHENYSDATCKSNSNCEIHFQSGTKSRNKYEIFLKGLRFLLSWVFQLNQQFKVLKDPTNG